VKGQEKLNRHIIFASVLVWFVQKKSGLDHAQGVSARRVSAQLYTAHLVSVQMMQSCAPARPWRGRRVVDLNRYHIMLLR